MEWEERVNGMASSLEKSLKKFTHRLAGLEHKEFDEEHWAKWQFKPIKGESAELIGQKKFGAKETVEVKEEQPENFKAISFGGQSEIRKKKFLEVLPTRVSRFDQLISDEGLERGSTILISGGAGTGKTTFSMQSIYHGAMNGEKGIYLSFEEEPEKIMAHMKKNYGFDFESLQKKGLVAIIKIDPSTIARSLEESLLEKEGGLKIRMKKITFPFVPDRVIVDSLSALSIAFEKEETYRKYLRELFEALEESQAISFVITETEQNPTVYSRTGVEEFLADGVVVLYNLKKNDKRENALEILKLRSSKHKKGLVPYRFGQKGLEIME